MDAWRGAVASAEASGAAAEAIERLRRATASDEPALVSDGFLRCVLRAKGYDLKKATKLFKNYVGFRRRTKWHADLVNAAAVEPELRSGFNSILPACDVHGHVVVTQQMDLLRSSSSSVEAHQRAGYYLLHRALGRDGAQTRGLALLLDFGGFSWQLMRAMHLADLRRGVNMLQDCCPARLSLIYILHPPSFLVGLVNMLRPLLGRETLQQKFVLCADQAALHEHIPPSRIPAGGPWGGTAPADWGATVDRWVAAEARVDGFDPASLVCGESAERL